MAKHTITIDTDDVAYRIEAEPEDVPVRGNAMASGDERADREAEDAILARLDAGDTWAWASVTVVASWHGIEGRDHLGCCSYDSEEDFRTAGDYFDDMKAEALADLLGKVMPAGDALTAAGFLVEREGR